MKKQPRFKTNTLKAHLIACVSIIRLCLCLCVKTHYQLMNINKAVSF